MIEITIKLVYMLLVIRTNKVTIYLMVGRDIDKRYRSQKEGTVGYKFGKILLVFT